MKSFLVLALGAFLSSQAFALECYLRGNPGGIQAQVVKNVLTCRIPGLQQKVILSQEGVSKVRCLGFPISVGCRKINMSHGR